MIVLWQACIQCLTVDLQHAQLYIILHCVQKIVPIYFCVFCMSVKEFKKIGQYVAKLEARIE